MHEVRYYIKRGDLQMDRRLISEFWTTCLLHMQDATAVLSD